MSEPIDELTKTILTWYAEVTGQTNVNFEPDMQVQNLIAEIEALIQRKETEARIGELESIDDDMVNMETEIYLEERLTELHCHSGEGE